jgi:hypothetical protein
VVHIELELSRLSPELEEALHARDRLLGSSSPLRKSVRLIEQATHHVRFGGGDGGLRVRNRVPGNDAMRRASASTNGRSSFSSSARLT